MYETAQKIGIAPDEYRAFCAFLQDACGIVLGDSKEYLVESRLNRLMSEYKLDSLRSLMTEMNNGRHVRLKASIIDAMTTNETFWFRDASHFRLLSEKILPELTAQTTRPIRIWSAACSSGQEPYTISMTVEEYQASHLSSLTERAEIVATDISSKALAEARRGKYCGMSVARGLDATKRQKFFLQKDDCLEVRPEIKRRVTFKEINLTEGYETLGKFDIIFCRNVLIYFSSAMKQDILARMSKALNPGGYLFLGSTESLSGHSHAFDMQSSHGGIAYKLRPTSR